LQNLVSAAIIAVCYAVVIAVFSYTIVWYRGTVKL